jgi:D-alanine-D-alanine ligase
MNIIVLTGGFSTERDVSFAMGGQIANALMQNGHKVVLLDTYGNIEKHNSFDALYKEHHKANYDFVVPENEPNLKLLKRLRGGNDLLGANILEACKTADICFIAQAGGVAENGQLSAIFDAFNIAYTGSGYIGSMLSIDKSIAKNIMKANGILTQTAKR